MSIEKIIEANTAAIEENTAVQKKILAMLQDGKAAKSEKPADKEESRGSRSRDRDEKEGREERTSRRERNEDDDRGSRSRSRDRDEDEDRGSRSRKDDDDDRGSRRRDKDEDEDRGSRSSSRSRDKDDDKPAGKKETSSRSSKPKKPKLADVRAAFATFMEVNPKDYDSDEDAKDEEESRRKFVEAILDEVGADKTSDIKEDDFERVLDWIKRKADGEKVRFDD